MRRSDFYLILGQLAFIHWRLCEPGFFKVANQIGGMALTVAAFVAMWSEARS